MSRLGAPQPGRFYPKLVYNGITLLFDDPPSVVRCPRKPIRNQNIADDGTLETVHQRFEQTVVMAWRWMEPELLDELESYFDTWGALGKAGVLTLDQYGTAAGQREYDQFNTFFTKAQLMNDPFDPQRASLGAPILYQIELLFRQGGSGN